MSKASFIRSAHTFRDTSKKKGGKRGNATISRPKRRSQRRQEQVESFIFNPKDLDDYMQYEM